MTSLIDPPNPGDSAPAPQGDDHAPGDSACHETPTSASSSPSDAAPSGMSQPDNPPPVTSAPGDSHPAAAKRRTLPLRRRGIENEERDRRRGIFNKLRILFAFLTLVYLATFFFVRDQGLDILMREFIETDSPASAIRGDRESEEPPDFDAAFAAELERIRPAPGEPPHEPGTPPAIRQEILEAIIRERAEDDTPPASPPPPEPPTPWMETRPILFLTAILPLFAVLFFGFAVRKVRSFPLFTPVAATGILFVTLVVDMAPDPLSMIGYLWVLMPGILIYLLVLGVLRMREPNDSTKAIDASPPSSVSGYSDAEDTSGKGKSSAEEVTASRGVDVGHGVHVGVEQPYDSGTHPRASHRPRSYHIAEIRRAQRLRNQRIFFGILGVFSLVLAAILFYHSRPGRYGLSKEAAEIVSPLSWYSGCQRSDEARQQRATQLFHAYYDMDDAPPMVLWKYVEEENITPYIVIRGIPVGRYYFGLAFKEQPSVKGFAWQIGEELQRRWDRKSAEGRRMALAMSVMLVALSLLSFVSIRLVRRFPVAAPLAGMILYAVGLWQIHPTGHVGFLLLMPFLVIVWVFYHPLVEGILLGIQMRRERRAQADAQDMPSAFPP